jgi:decaprenyl-phosphate phosphoribosyltransferase
MNDYSCYKKPSFLIWISGMIALMRLKQWVKNLFVFAPLIFSGAFLDSVAISNTFFIFILFCIASSASYILNDINDVNHDRLHPIKSKRRPLASGAISLINALMLLVILYSILVWAWFATSEVMIVIVAYLALNIAYTFLLKHQPVLDIFTIATGFVLRVWAGAMALNVPVSSWMFITTLCLALFLASIKRRQELSLNGADGRKVLKKYSISLANRYAEMSATCALLFYSMFVMSTRPELVITVPLVMFGMFRYWYVVEELDGGESPTDALLSDWQLLLTVGLWVALCCWSLLPLKV